MGDLGKVRSFLLGTLLGGLMGIFLVPRRRKGEAAAPASPGRHPRSFEGAACQTARDAFS